MGALWQVVEYDGASREETLILMQESDAEFIAAELNLDERDPNKFYTAEEYKK